MVLITSGPERQLYSHRRICLHISSFNIPFFLFFFFFPITFLNYTFAALYSLYLVFGPDLISGYLTLIPHFPSFPFILLLSSLFLCCYSPGLLLCYIYHHAVSVPEITPTFICLCVAFTLPRYISLSFICSLSKHFEWTSRISFLVQYVYILYTFHPAPCFPQYSNIIAKLLTWP